MPRHTTSDPNSARWHLAKLDSLRGRTALEEGERRCILRVFYALKEENTKVYHHQADQQMLVLAQSVYLAEHNVLLAV